MPAPVSACVIIDTSASMTGSGYVANTVIDSKAFIAYALPGDAIGIVNYDTQGNYCYAPNGALALVDQTLSQIPLANSAIAALSFYGGCTNIGDGIQKAYALLGPSGVSPKAAVLLTDGYQNCGTDPRNVPPTFPVYACAMGPSTDTGLLQTIATRTNGLYYYMPYPVNMMTIYNQIRSSQPRIQGVVNYLSQLSSAQQSLLIPAQISGTSEMHQVGVVWDNASYAYSPSPNPGPGQLYIVLYQPNGQLFAGSPALVGSGYVIFNVPNPTSGQWYASIQYAGGPNSVSVTTGVFEFTPASASEIRLEVAAPPVAAGGKLQVTAHMVDDDEPVELHSIQAEITSPTISVPQALDKYRDEISSMALAADEPGHEDDRPERRLGALHRLYLPAHDLMPHRTRGAPMAPQDDGSHAVLVEAGVAGSHNVIVRARGYSAKSKTWVQRTQMLTVPVSET